MEGNMETAIVRKQMDLGAWQMIRDVAPIVHKSRLFGVATEEQAAAIMIKGYEMGLGFSLSFEFIQVVQGKPTLIPRGALALAYQSGLIDWINISEIKDDKGAPYACKVSGKRKDGIEYEVLFTMDDARRAGLVKDDSGWVKYPANMLKWRAIGFWLDIVLPDVQGGMKRADELGAAVDEAGNIIDVVSVPVLPKSEINTNLPTLEQLLDEYDPERVQNAMDQVTGGNFPVNEEELQRVIQILRS